VTTAAISRTTAHLLIVTAIFALDYTMA
jgi:hypothetical protein